jgi:teichuronic acid biosynthesis glycosyltransferase TuaC
VHVHCAYPDAVGVEKAARKLGIPFVVTAHGSDINVYSKHSSLTGKIRSALEQASAVVAVSENLSAQIRRLVPGIDGRLSCIPCCGVNPETFHVGATAKPASGPRTVLFVGNLVPIKGVDTLLEAWRRLFAQGVVREGDRLMLVGAGPLRAQLEHSAADLKGSVGFLGPRPQSEIAALMREATVLCLSSRNEGMPNVVVEALASGLPVAATAVGGVPELVRPGVNGELAAGAEAAELAGALVRVFEKKWDADQIASSVSGYNWDNLAARNLDVLSRALRLAKTR